VEKEENTARRSAAGSLSSFRYPGGGLWITMPPHWGSKKAYDGDGVSVAQRDSEPTFCSYCIILPSFKRIRRGRRCTEGIKRTKWRTGSLEELEAKMPSVIIQNTW